MLTSPSSCCYLFRWVSVCGQVNRFGIQPTTKENSAIYTSWVGKSVTGLSGWGCEFMARRVYPCRVAGKTVRSHVVAIFPKNLENTKYVGNSMDLENFWKIWEIIRKFRLTSCKMAANKMHQMRFPGCKNAFQHVCGRSSASEPAEGTFSALQITTITITFCCHNP